MLTHVVGERPEPRRGFVTRHQVTGWKFALRRTAAGIALHDSRMLVDPLRTQSRAYSLGLLLLVAGVAGAFLFSLISPVGAVSEHQVLGDKSTATLYVRLGETVHPVLNLASARLIVGTAEEPTWIQGSELNNYRRGNTVGIPGAPTHLKQTGEKDAQWSVCDTAPPPAGGTRSSVTVIAGSLVGGEGKAATLTGNRAVVARSTTSDWLIWDGHRARIDLSNQAVTSALGLGPDTPAPRVLAEALLNVIPEIGQISAPTIMGEGEKPQFPFEYPVGSIVASRGLGPEAQQVIQNYVVLPTGLQPLSPILAAIIRNTNSYGLKTPPLLTPDEIARIPQVKLLDPSGFPSGALTVVSPSKEPVLCARWSRPSDSPLSTLQLLSGATVPVSHPENAVPLVGAGQENVADKVIIPPGSGYLTQIVGQESSSQTREALFWISDTGVRYGIDTSEGKTVEMLGLREPAVVIPWSILRLFAQGPTLSQADALVAHDSLPQDPRPAHLTKEAGR